MKKIVLLTGIFLLYALPVWGHTHIVVTHVVKTHYAVGGYTLDSSQKTLHSNKPRSSVSVFNPLPTVTPTRTYYDDIYDTIHMLESTRGKAPVGHHIYCRDRGMWNEIGYNPQGKFCFKNEEEGKAKVMSWFQDKIERGYSVWEAACLWNIGKRVSNCEYATHF